MDQLIAIAALIGVGALVFGLRLALDKLFAKGKSGSCKKDCGCS